MKGIVKLPWQSRGKPFSRKKAVKAMKSEITFSHFLISGRFFMIDGKVNIQGENLVESCI